MTKRHTRAHPGYKNSGIYKELPPNCERGTYYHLSPDIIQFEGSALVQNRIEEEHIGLHDIFREWGEMWVWKHFKIEDNGRWVAEAITRGSATIVCDGSYQPKLTTTIGAAAWTIECSITKKRLFYQRQLQMQMLIDPS
jgi:hypothetical protein